MVTPSATTAYRTTRSLGSEERVFGLWPHNIYPYLVPEHKLCLWSLETSDIFQQIWILNVIIIKEALMKFQIDSTLVQQDREACLACSWKWLIFPYLPPTRHPEHCWVWNNNNNNKNPLRNYYFSKTKKEWWNQGHLTKSSESFTFGQYMKLLIITRASASRCVAKPVHFWGSISSV